MSELIKAIDFENAVKVDDRHLNIDLPHYFNFGGTLADGRYHSGEDGARFWVEEGFAHSGSRCIGMELFDITKARRNEFTLSNLKDLGLDDEYGMSIWMLVLPDWMLHAPDPAWQRWYDIYTPLASDKNPLGHYTPKLECMITQPTLNVPTFNLLLSHRSYNDTHTFPQSISPFPLPRGRWFNVRGWLRRHKTDGAVKVWFGRNLVFDVAGIETRWDGYEVCMAKIYHALKDFTTHRLWVDDLEIYDGIPPTPISPFNLKVAALTTSTIAAATYAASQNPVLSLVLSALGGLGMGALTRGTPSPVPEGFTCEVCGALLEGLVCARCESVYEMVL